MDYQTVILSVDGAVATITLNRPEALNALSPELVRDFSQAAREVELQPEVKALVIRGAGRAFCTGADLGTISGYLEDPHSLAEYMTTSTPCFSSWRSSLCLSSVWSMATPWQAVWSCSWPATWS